MVGGAPASASHMPVSSISGCVVNTSFTYDANGNMTSGNGLTVTYTPFNKPATIARGSNQIGLAHDPEHQRFKQTAASGETIYLNGSGVLSERLIGSGGVTQWTDSRGANIPGYRAYLGTPSGVFRVYDPATKQDTVFK